MKTIPLGSIAENLSSPRQIFLVCLALLSDVAPNAAECQRQKHISKIVENNDTLNLIQIYQLNRAISSIISDLNKHVPPFTYFGYHTTDKSRLGVWIDLDSLRKAENSGQLTQISGGSWTGIKSTYVLDMSGNGIILYKRRGKKSVWAIN